MATPPFIFFGGRIINTSQIKWAGMRTGEGKEEPRLQIEFIAEGWTRFEPGVTLEMLAAGLHLNREDSTPRELEDEPDDWHNGAHNMLPEERAQGVNGR